MSSLHGNVLLVKNVQRTGTEMCDCDWTGVVIFSAFTVCCGIRPSSQFSPYETANEPR